MGWRLRPRKQAEGRWSSVDPTRTPEYLVLVDAAKRAAALCEHVCSRAVSTGRIEKEDRTPITVADYASQALICQAILEVFPGDSIVAEESSNLLRMEEHRDLRSSVLAAVREQIPTATDSQPLEWVDTGRGSPGERFWCLDPLDGTQGYLRGGQYAIAIALIEEGVVSMACLACPRYPMSGGINGVLFLASRHQGAAALSLHDESPLALPTSQPDAAQVDVKRYVESPNREHSDGGLQAEIASMLGLDSPPIAMDSQAKYAYVAMGEAALYLRLPRSNHRPYEEKIWDHAAGSLLLEETGGCVTDALGAKLVLSAARTMPANCGVVASRGLDHAAVLQAIHKARISHRG